MILLSLFGLGLCFVLFFWYCLAVTLDDTCVCAQYLSCHLIHLFVARAFQRGLPCFKLYFPFGLGESCGLSFGWALGHCGASILAVPSTTGGVLQCLAGAIRALPFCKAHAGTWKASVSSRTSPGRHLVPQGVACGTAKTD